jgi:hypothetical protein
MRAMTDPNEKLLEQARANVAERYNSRYHVNAIIGGEWDNGQLIKGEVTRLLTQPEIGEGDE